MHTYPFHAMPVGLRYGVVFFTVVLALLLMPRHVVQAQGSPGSNTQPLAFGPGQLIVDLNKLVWVPLEAEGVPPGPEMAVLRGDGKAAGFEVMVRLPAHYTFPNHSHTSDEHYVWLKGDFTYIAADGTATPLSGQTYISGHSCIEALN